MLARASALCSPARAKQVPTARRDPIAPNGPPCSPPASSTQAWPGWRTNHREPPQRIQVAARKIRSLSGRGVTLKSLEPKRESVTPLLHNRAEDPSPSTPCRAPRVPWSHRPVLGTWKVLESCEHLGSKTALSESSTWSAWSPGSAAPASNHLLQPGGHCALGV